MADEQRSAVISMPTAGQMGGEGPLPFARFPFFPTAPWYSTNPNVGYQVRYYSTGLNPLDQDYSVGSESVRNVQFDIPVRLSTRRATSSIRPRASLPRLLARLATREKSAVTVITSTRARPSPSVLRRSSPT